MSLETSVDALTAQTTGLLDECLTLRTSVALSISSAVATSTNAALIPLVTMSRNLVDTQTLLITLITR